jgi:hypothetical protein
VNNSLKLETWQKVLPIPQEAIRYGLPQGLLEGWRISHAFIRKSKVVHKPDSSGFYHALSYWIHGEQDRYDSIRKALANALGQLIPSIVQPATKKRPLLSSILDPFDPLGLINIKKEFKYAYHNKKICNHPMENWNFWG